MGSRRAPTLSIAQEGQLLVESLGCQWTELGGMCRCPAHDDRTPSLSIRAGRTRLLFHCFAGCDAARILQALESNRLLKPNAGGAAKRDADRSNASHSDAARRIWNESRSIAGTRAEAYLAARGVASHSPELRYHPRTPDGAAPMTRFRPALIAAVRDDTGLTAIHRTFIDPGLVSPAGFQIERRGLGRYGRGSVRLGGVAARIGLAEGIETALSASSLFGVPCWATLGSERFRQLSLPTEVDELLLFLDRDAAGRGAERRAREAFPHLRIECHYPDRPGDDWNDVLLSTSAKR